MTHNGFLIDPLGEIGLMLFPVLYLHLYLVCTSPTVPHTQHLSKLLLPGGGSVYNEVL